MKRTILHDLKQRFRAARAARNLRAASIKTVAVTGSSGKSTTTALVADILSGSSAVETLVQPRFDHDLFDFAIGVKRSTDFVVAELSIGEQGHLQWVVDMLRPTVGIVTLVGLEHHKLYRTTDRIAAEKARLVAALPSTGLAVLNADDDLVMAMRDRTRARVVTFGRERPADYRIVSASSAYPDPLRLVVDWAGGRTELTTRIIGEQFWLPVVAAFATAVELGVAPSVASSRIAEWEPLADRCQPYRTDGGPTFLLDTVKAPQHSLTLAFAAMANARAERKRIVLGQISDYPGNPKKIYRRAYQQATQAADQVVFVGNHAHRSNASAADREAGRFVQCASVEQVAKLVAEQSGPGDLILLKGSQNLHLERVALSWTHKVRCWEDYCGLRMSCFECGMFEIPFKQHDAIRSLAKDNKSSHSRWKKTLEPK